MNRFKRATTLKTIMCCIFPASRSLKLLDDWSKPVPPSLGWPWSFSVFLIAFEPWYNSFLTCVTLHGKPKSMKWFLLLESCYQIISFKHTCYIPDVCPVHQIVFAIRWGGLQSFSLPSKSASLTFYLKSPVPACRSSPTFHQQYWLF